MLKGWIWILILGLGFCGCRKTPDASVRTESKPVEYEFVFEAPEFMEESPDLGVGRQIRWIWQTKDRLTSLSHIKVEESLEVLESAQYLKYMVEEKVGLTLEAEITRESPTRYTYVNQDEDGWEYLVAEATSDQKCTIAIYGIYASVTGNLPSETKAEAILEALKAGRFEEANDENKITPGQSRVTSEIQER